MRAKASGTGGITASMPRSTDELSISLTTRVEERVDEHRGEEPEDDRRPADSNDRPGERVDDAEADPADRPPGVHAELASEAADAPRPGRRAVQP